MRKLFFLAPMGLIVFFAACEAISGWAEARTPEELDQMNAALQTLSNLGLNFISPAQALVHDAVTAIVTGLSVWLGRNATRKRDLAKVTST